MITPAPTAPAADGTPAPHLLIETFWARVIAADLDALVEFLAAASAPTRADLARHYRTEHAADRLADDLGRHAHTLRRARPAPDTTDYPATGQE